MLITSGTLSAGTIYTATEPCRICINGSALKDGTSYQQPMFYKINGNASSSNNSFSNSSGTFRVNDNEMIHKISAIYTNTSDYSIVSVDLDKGEYLSVATNQYGNITGNYYVYSR